MDKAGGKTDCRKPSRGNPSATRAVDEREGGEGESRPPGLALYVSERSCSPSGPEEGSDTHRSIGHLS
jgi:hypothetical protein